MGMFVNPGNQAFQVAVNSEIYKSRVGKPTVLTVGVCQAVVFSCSHFSTVSRSCLTNFAIRSNVKPSSW